VISVREINRQTDIVGIRRLIFLIDGFAEFAGQVGNNHAGRLASRNPARRFPKAIPSIWIPRLDVTFDRESSLDAEDASCRDASNILVPLFDRSKLFAASMSPLTIHIDTSWHRRPRNCDY